MKIAVFQTDIIWEDAVANRTHLDQLFAGFLADANSASDLVVLPEMFTTGFSMAASHMAETMQGETLRWMKSKAEEYDTALLGTLPLREPAGRESPQEMTAETNPSVNYYNRAVFVSPDGTVTSYDKRHLFGPGGEDKIYTPGNSRLIVEYKGWRICPLICYDLRFPVWSRCRNDYDMLVYMANWPAVRMSAWDILLPARAVENQGYVIGVNRAGSDPAVAYTGHSGIFDPNGEPIVTAGPEEEVLTAELNLESMRTLRTRLPFQKQADQFKILC